MINNRVEANEPNQKFPEKRLGNEMSIGLSKALRYSWEPTTYMHRAMHMLRKYLRRQKDYNSS